MEVDDASLVVQFVECLKEKASGPRNVRLHFIAPSCPDYLRKNEQLERNYEDDLQAGGAVQPSLRVWGR